jgi:hypothetical protein
LLQAVRNDAIANHEVVMASLRSRPLDPPHDQLERDDVSSNRHHALSL